jgi:transcriptional regulator with XRE-family HTH domain
MVKVRLGQIGALVRERRGNLGVRNAAKEIGVSAATLSRIENGKQPDLSTFEKLCRWLEVSPSEFLDAGNHTSEADTNSPSPVVATAHLRAKRQVTPELAQALGEMIMRAQYMFPDEPDAENSS